MKKLATLLILILAFTSTLALADVGKGDRGEEVRYLQWLLQRTGWLNDKPDGIFGGHTEQAVMDYQASLGLEATGVADAELMQQLDRERVRQDKQANGADYYEPYSGSYVPPYDTGYAVPFHCQTTALGDVSSRDFCERHLGLLKQEYRLTVGQDAAGFAEASALWLQEIDAMYTEWADETSGARQEQIQAAQKAWDNCFSAQRDALTAGREDDVTAERQLLLMLKSFAATLCEVRSGDAPAPLNAQGMLIATAVEPEDPTLAGTADPVVHCEFWSLNRNTEFVTCCDDHAALLQRERDWAAAGAESISELKPVAEAWQQALSALYDRWESQEGDAVSQARAAFEQALALQDGLLNGDMATLARLRVFQFETARLCALLNGAED